MKKPWVSERNKRILREKHPQWKGGRTLDKQKGHIYILNPKHPKARYGGGRYVAEHRLIMEQHLGRFLKDTEIVHHINKIPFDNRIENLKLVQTNTEHKKLHRTPKRLCTIKGCPRMQHGKQLCRMHYNRKRNNLPMNLGSLRCRKQKMVWRCVGYE